MSRSQTPARNLAAPSHSQGSPEPRSEQRPGAPAEARSPAPEAPDDPPPDDARADQDLNARLIQPLLAYLRETYGPGSARRILRAAGLSDQDTAGGKYWMSHAQFEDILRRGRALMRDDEEFRHACSYHLAKSYGALRFLVRATSVARTLALAESTMHLVSRISHYELLSVERDHIHTVYRTTRPESRLMCLSRQSQIEAFATLWGLPRAHVKQEACVARGDDRCEYHVRWYQHPRWLPSAVGALIGGGSAAALLAATGGLLWPTAPLLGLLSGAVGHLWELRRVYRHNVSYGEENNEQLRDLARRYAEALQEINALNQRHRDWSRLLEEQITERQRQMESSVGRMEKILKQRELTARSAGHDMKSPLVLLKNLRWMLEPYVKLEEPGAAVALEDLADAADKMDRIATDFLSSATNTSGDLISMRQVTIPVPPLVERLRRRLRAQVLDKPIRVSVFATREAPESIESDQLLFDRVMDNLLTNAARYTDQGSIVVELTGSSDSLVVKVSDTGPGISTALLRKVFEPGERLGSENAEGFGLGMSIVVRLLDQIGGRLEVMSKPDVGTTFWAHFPFHPRPREARSATATVESLQDIVGRVVVFRPAND